jgi:hypothetical protein
MLIVFVSTLFIVAGLLVSIGIPALGIRLQHHERIDRDVTASLPTRTSSGELALLRQIVADYEAAIHAYRQAVQGDLETSGVRR